MTKQLQEANVNLSIQDLNSSDMATLSQILSLAGQAEQPTGMDMGTSSLTMAGPDGDLSSDVGGVDLGTPEVTVGTVDDAMGAYDMGAGEPGVDDPMGMDMPANDDPAITIDDDGLGEPDMDMELDTGMDDMLEGFDRIAELSGIQLAEEADAEEEVIDEGCGETHVEEEMIEEEADADSEEEVIEEEVSVTDDFEWLDDDSEDSEETDVNVYTAGNEMRESLDQIDAIIEGEEALDEEDQLDENAEGMYNVDLDEDAVEEMKSPGIGDNRVFGPYPNEQACMIDARKEIPGAMRNREVNLIHKPDGWYWNKIHANTNKVPVRESEQTVDDLAAQLNEQFEAFMKGE